MRLHRSTKADILVSLGSTCRPAGHLRRAKLRFLSSPLDWMMGYSLNTALHLFKTEFADFFENRAILPTSEAHHIHVKDTLNEITSLHAFPLNCDLEHYYLSTFRPLMLRRFQTLNSFLVTSKHTIFICDRMDPINKLVDTIQQIGDLYPHSCITLINIRTGATADEHSTESHIINSRLTITDHLINDQYKGTVDTDAWLGNVDIWKTILADFRLPLNSRVKTLLNRSSWD